MTTNDHAADLKAAIIDLTPAIAGWNARNFPKSGPTHKAYGMVEEIGEAFHVILKDLQGIRIPPEEFADRLGDAMADLCIYALAFASHFVNAQLSVEFVADMVADVVVDGVKSTTSDEAADFGRERGASEMACLASFVAGVADSVEDLSRVSAIRVVCSILSAAHVIARNFYGIDLPAALRRTWEQIVSKRDWVADPMNAAEVGADV